MLKLQNKLLAVLLLFLSACATTPMAEQTPIAELFPQLEADESLSQATFAAGCFWCTEGSFQEMEGVEEVVSGYVGGEEVDPTYEDVVSHRTGHREGVRVYYHADQVSYEDLLERLWGSIDPSDDGGQFTDRGFNYTTAIYFHDEQQKALAEASKKALEESGKYEQVATEILPLTSFYPAEDYHQDFYLHSAERYKQFKEGSGRNVFFGK